MSILASIKGEKRLSMNHWRFKLLHWFTGEEEGDCAKFFYTHYCPLFHFTNLIALFLPLIIAWKVAFSIGAVVFGVLDKVFTRIGKIVEAFCERRAAKAKLKPKRERVVKVSYDKIRILNDIIQHADLDFANWWHSREEAALYYNDSKEHWEAEFEKIHNLYTEAIARKKAKKEAMRQRIIFWVNFSQAFIKGLLYLVYVAAFLGVIWGVFTFGAGVIAAIGWFFSLIGHGLFEFNWLWFITMIGKILAMVAAGAATIWFGLRFRIFQTVIEAFLAAVAGLLSPFVSAVAAVFNFIGARCTGVVEFCAMFFEENCPPIILVNDDEAALEED